MQLFTFKQKRNTIGILNLGQKSNTSVSSSADEETISHPGGGKGNIFVISLYIFKAFKAVFHFKNFDWQPKRPRKLNYYIL